MEKNNRKQIGKRSYGSLFIKRHLMNRRRDKTIYVRKECHERLSRIVQVIGGGNIPLYAYLDNILKHHFELFSGEIIKDFDKMNKPLF